MIYTRKQLHDKTESRLKYNKNDRTNLSINNEMRSMIVRDKELYLSILFVTVKQRYSKELRNNFKRTLMTLSTKTRIAKNKYYY